MPPPILFVVVETGAARFAAPLWRRWLNEDGGAAWRVVLGPMAARYLADSDLGRGLPVLAETSATTDDMESLLGGWRPRGVLASAGDHYPLEAAAADYARTCGVPSAQFIDTWTNYRRRFAHPNGAILPDHIAVIDERAAAEAVAEGLPFEKLRVIGQPTWENSLMPPAAPREQVLFLGAPMVRDFGDALGYDEWTSWAVVLEAARRFPDLFERLWYGKHPGQTDVDAARLGPATLVEDSLQLLAHAGSVIGMASSPMVEAFLAGRNVVSVQPNAVGPDLCPLSRHGRIPRADTPESLAEALGADPLQSGDLAASLRGSTDRLDRFLKDVLIH